MFSILGRATQTEDLRDTNGTFLRPPAQHVVEGIHAHRHATRPQHERHEELMEWCGQRDPEAFDAAKATREMRKRS
jgi:hypothetical protein